MTTDNLILYIPVFGILALLFTWWKTKVINSHSEGTTKMAKIASSIQEGAMAFLKQNTKYYLYLFWRLLVYSIGAVHKTPTVMGLWQFPLLSELFVLHWLAIWAWS